jgi:hypothetical protein
MGRTRYGTDHHAPVPAVPAGDRRAGHGEYYYGPDEIEDTCPGCTLIWSGGKWVHDPACLFARTRAD